jgi:hypothetical protein
VQSPSDSQRAGLKDLYAALTVVALEPLKLPTAALPKGLLSPAEFCILQLLGYTHLTGSLMFWFSGKEDVSAFIHLI